MRNWMWVLGLAAAIPLGGCSPKTSEATQTPAASPAPAAAVDFASTVKPVMEQRCGRCHVEEKKGGLSLASLSDVLAGGKSGVVVVAGNANGSLLYKMITGQSGVKHMPPKGEPLTTDQLAAIKTWIDAGAH